MDKILVEQNLSEFLSISCELEQDEIILYLESADVTNCYSLIPEEWDNLLLALQKADKAYKELQTKEISD